MILGEHCPFFYFAMIKVFMRMNKNLAQIIVVGLTAFALTACKGESNTSSNSPPSPSSSNKVYDVNTPSLQIWQEAGKTHFQTRISMEYGESSVQFPADASAFFQFESLSKNQPYNSDSLYTLDNSFHLSKSLKLYHNYLKLTIPFYDS